MPTIDQLPLVTDLGDSDQVPLSQGGVSRSVTVATLLGNTQETITIATNTLLGRTSAGPGGPEAIAIGTGLQIQNDVLLVDQSAFPQTSTLNTSNTMLLNSSTTGTPQLMPISLLRGLYTAGANITIDPDGTIHSTPAAATGNTIGAVAVGNALVINASGQLSVNIGTVSGTVAAGNDSRIVNSEQLTHKNQPNGYAGLDNSGLVPASLLPAGGGTGTGGGGGAVDSVNGQTGTVVINAGNLPGLGTVATQNANAVALTGGTIAGVDASGATAAPAITGAVPRSLAARFAEHIDVNDFALARDGLTDDSSRFITACQAAISARKALYIPAGGPILLTDAAQQNIANVTIFGDGIRDYYSPQGYGHEGSVLWFTGTTKSPFLLGANVHFKGLNFYWPNQTEIATTTNAGQPIVYPPLFAMQATPTNIVYFNLVDCQITNCYDLFTATSTIAVVGGCTVERCIIYAIHTCFTLANVPEVFFMANNLFTYGVYGTVVSVGPTYNLRTYTNTQGTWLKVVGNGTTSQIASTTVGGIMSCNNYVYGCSRGIWLAAGTLDISAFVNTSFDTVPTVIQGDPGCAMFSTRFTGGTWYPIYLTNTGPDTTAIVINNPAPGGVGMNVTFAGLTVPFVNGSFAQISGSNISNISFTDIRCNALGHTSGGTGPYYGFQFNTPNANLRVSGCDFQTTYSGLSNTAVQINACTQASITNNVLRAFSAPIDVQTASGIITLSGNVTQATPGPSTIVGIGTTNVRDLGNVWDVTNFAYNGFAPTNYRPGATIGVMPVASTAAAGYIGVQPSATGTGGGTRFGVSGAGSGPVSLLTNAFNEEQMRINRVASAVNYVTVKGAISGATSQISTGGADANSALQLSGLGTGATYFGSIGVNGSPTIRLGALVDQNFLSSAPGNGFSITVPVNISTLLLRPAGNLATGSVVLPAAIADGEKIEIWTSRTITALTVTSAAGAIVTNGAAFQLGANSTVLFFWNAATNTWFQRLGGGSANGSISGQDANNVLITGGSITGLSQLSVGTDASVSANLILDTAPGFARQLVFESTSLPRFVVGVEGNPENNVTVPTSAAVPSGSSSLPLSSVGGISPGMLVSAVGVAPSTTVTAVTGTTGVQLSQPTSGALANGAPVLFYTNQGTDFAILPYDDSGAPLSPTLGQPLVITRATGQTTIRTLLVNSTATVPTPPPGDNSTQAATTAFVAAAIAGSAVLASAVGGANGVASLDGTGHVPVAQLPASLQGALNYQGTWNAATNLPALASGTGVKGSYYTVATAGTTPLNGITQWSAGDHAAFNGTAWEKLDGLASEVISVAGRTGAVVLSITDIGGLGSMAAQNAGAVALTGGAIDAVGIGAAVPAAGAFSTLAAASVSLSGGTADNLAVGTTTPAAGSFTNVTASGSVTLTQATLTVPAFAGLGLQGGGLAGSGRGLGAFDGQQYRSTAGQVASGQYAVQFGTGNTTAAPGSIAVGGSNTVSGSTGYAGAFGGSNTVSGSYAYAFGNSHALAGSYAHAFGFRARDFGRYGVSVLASGFNASNGDAQRGETILRATSTGTATRLTADGGVAGPLNVVNLQNSQMAKVNIEITGYNAGANAGACWIARDVLLARGASAAATTLSSSSLVAGATVGTTTGWTAPSIGADTINGGLTINSGFAASTTIKWVARIVSVEVM